MFNKVILVGTPGNVPEAKGLGENTFVATFSLYTSETWTDKATGQRRETSVRHTCEAWNKLAVSLSKNMKTDRKYVVEGQLAYDDYNKEGQDHRVAKVKVKNVRFL